jgi:hypothetical protein
VLFRTPADPPIFSSKTKAVVRPRDRGSLGPTHFTTINDLTADHVLVPAFAELGQQEYQAKEWYTRFMPENPTEPRSCDP